MAKNAIEPKITQKELTGEWVLIGSNFDKEMFIDKALKKCRTLSEKIYLLRGVADLDNEEICRLLNIDLHTVENIVWRLRKKGLKIPDKRIRTTAEKLRGRMTEILSSVVAENVNLS